MLEVDMSQVRDLFKRINKALDEGSKPSRVAQCLLVGARVIRDEAKRTAPVRKRVGTFKGGIPRTGKKRPGVLKRAIKAYKFRDRPGMPPAAIVGPSKKAAPHRHLVAMGTGPRFRGVKKDRKTGAWVGTGSRFGYTGYMTPNPFFEQAVARKTPEAYQKISEAIDNLFRQSMRKAGVA